MMGKDRATGNMFYIPQQWQSDTERPEQENGPDGRISNNFFSFNKRSQCLSVEICD